MAIHQSDCPSRRQVKKVIIGKEKQGFFEWLLHDKEYIVPMTMFMGYYGALIVYGIALVSMMLAGMYNIFTLIIAVFFVFTAWKLIKIYRMGGFKNMKGMCLNDMVYGGKKWN